MPSDAKARRAASKKKAVLNRKQKGGDGAGASNSEASSLNGDSTPGTPVLMSANSSSSEYSLSFSQISQQCSSKVTGFYSFQDC